MFIERKEWLAHSGRRYIVDNLGRVYLADGTPIAPTLVDNQWCVRLTWINGLKDYPVGQLVIVTFKHIYLPDHLWYAIEPMYLDDDATNNHVDNLSYCFKEGLLEVEGYSGFYYIPFNTRYAIDRFGNCHDTLNDFKQKPWYVIKSDPIRNSKGGYVFTRITNVPKVSGVLYRHRALCYVFKPYPANVETLVVNHKDGCPGNDTLDNLEWTTYAKNNKHAHDTRLTGQKAHPILMKDLKTGLVTQYPSIKACAVELGLSNTRLIRHRLRHESSTLFADYWLFKWDDGTEWPEIDLSTTIALPVENGGQMAARNVYTGEVIQFDTFKEGEELTGVGLQTIANHLRDRLLIPFNGYNFRYVIDNMEWPGHPAFNLEAYKAYPYRTPDPVIVTDLVDGKEQWFLSRNEAAVAFNISPSYTTALTMHNQVLRERFAFRYYRLRENIQVPSDWKV